MNFKKYWYAVHGESVKFLLTAFMSVIVITQCLAQANNATEEQLEYVSVLLNRGDCTTAIAILDTLSIDDSTTPYANYYRAVADDMCGASYAAKLSLEKSIAAFDKHGGKDEFFLDANFRLINFLRKAEDWQHIAELSKNALAVPKEVLDGYPLTYTLYECYAQSLNKLTKYAAVEGVVRDGLSYVEKSLSPTDKEYYNLRIIEIVALTLSNRWERAASRLNELAQINQQRGNNVLDYELSYLTDTVNRHRQTTDWHHEADKHIDIAINYAKSLLLYAPPTTAEGSELWNEFFYTIIDELELNHFDISSPEDERFWSRMLACLIAHFEICCQDLTDREQTAYDIILLRKNFLDYHTGLLHKKPKRWQDIRESLSDGELAIEITMFPDEVLILGKDFGAPVAITIPEDISEQIYDYSTDDAVVVNEYYSEGSPLSRIIELIQPYLDGVHTIYLSPANQFAQFNYSAVPYKEKRFEDVAHIIQMTTTADISNFKKTNGLTPTPNPSILIGGVDYDNVPEKKSLEPNADLSFLTSELRSGFDYLPYSLQEVENISAIIGSDNCLLLTGKDANEEVFLNLSKTHSTILHLATHGYSIPAPPNQNTDSISMLGSILSRTGLLLAGANKSLQNNSLGRCDGILTSAEITKMDLSRIRLTVLSFCSSGLGDITNTTGVVYGVANAMKTSGVHEVLIALWDIPDKATAVAMTSFYKHLMETRNTHESIRLMRRDMISQGYTDPYYWAAFVVLD